MTFLMHMLGFVIRIVVTVFTTIIGLFIAGMALFIGMIGLVIFKLKYGKAMGKSFKDMSDQYRSKTARRESDYSLDSKTIEVDEYEVVED